MSTKFGDSLAHGPHAVLTRAVGDWEGTARTWFEPGKLGDTSPVRGSVRSVLGGRFVVHEYEGTLCGDALRGLAIIGHALPEGRWECAWVDSFHNGTRIMLSLGEAGAAAEPPSVLGSYPAPEGPPWGWRTELDVSGAPGRLVVRHFNITPDGDEALAVELDYRRAGG